MDAETSIRFLFEKWNWAGQSFPDPFSHTELMCSEEKSLYRIKDCRLWR